MAYGIKYHIQYTNEKGNVTLVNILKNGHVSPDTEIQGGSNDPVSIRWFGEGEDKYSPIHGSEASVALNVTTDFQFSEFIEVDDDEYRIDINHDGTLLWRGWMIPDLHQEQYKDPPYSLTIRAIDGLGRLKGIDYTIPATPRQSIMRTIWDCLDQVGSELSLYEAVDLYETTMSVQESASPLTQAQINTAGFKDSNGDVFDCHRVLTEILKPFGCRMHQDAGAWWIVPVNLMDAAFVARKWDAYNDFDIANSYFTGGLYTPTISTGTDKNIVGALTIQPIIPAYTKHTIEFTAGVVSNLITDGEFEEAAWSSTTALIEWVETSINILKVPGSGENGSVWACDITDANTTFNSGEHIESKPVTVSSGSGGVTNQFSFRFKYSVFATGGSGVFVGYYEIRLEPSAGGNPYYLQPLTFTWVQEASPGSQLNITHSSGTPGWEDAILADENGQFFDIPADGQIYIRFYTPDVDASWVYGGWKIDSVIMLLADQGNLPTEFEFWDGTVTNAFSFYRSKKVGDLKVMFGDVSNFAGNDFGTGTFAQFDFDIGTITAGDSITFTMSSVAQTYTAVSSSPTGNQFTTSLELYLAIRIDAGTDYQVITDDTLNPTHFTIIPKSVEPVFTSKTP